MEEKFDKVFNKLLEERGLTQLSFARLIGVAHATVGKWARGEAVPSNKFIGKISQSLDIPVEVIETLCGVENKIEDEFCLKLRNKLRDCGISQKDFAKKLNLTEQMISTWFSGKVVPGIKTKNKIAEFFGKTIKEFLTEESSISNEMKEIKFDKSIFIQLEEIKKEIENIYNQAIKSAEKINNILSKNFKQ